MSFDLRINNGDLVIGSNGDVDKVTGSEKLIQDILKILMTPLGGNKFFPWYGNILSTTMIGQVFDATFMKTAIDQQIRSGLETIQRLQKDQSARGQKVSPGELLAAVQAVTVNRNMLDPTSYSIRAIVLTKEFKSAIASLDISL